MPRRCKPTKGGSKRTAAKKWSGAVSRRSDALDLEQSIFKSASAARKRVLQQAKDELRKAFHREG
jgi:hypothetical protein